MQRLGQTSDSRAGRNKLDWAVRTSSKSSTSKDAAASSSERPWNGTMAVDPRPSPCPAAGAPSMVPTERCLTRLLPAGMERGSAGASGAVACIYLGCVGRIQVRQLATRPTARFGRGPVNQSDTQSWATSDATGALSSNISQTEAIEAAALSQSLRQSPFPELFSRALRKPYL